MYMYIYIHIYKCCVYIYVCMYIYIYIKREKESIQQEIKFICKSFGVCLYQLHLHIYISTIKYFHSYQIYK